MRPWVLIPNRDGRRWLPECLGSLRASAPGAPVLLVDNASSDGGPEFVAEAFPEVRVLRLERNLGFVHAMNLALLAARGEGARDVVLLNNDTRLSRDWLDLLEDVARRRPDLGILSPWQRDFAGKDSPRTRVIVDRWRRQAGADAPIPEVIETDWVEGSCLFIRGAAIDAIGFLDPLFAPAYFEETDFCRRARRRGFGVGLATRASIEHFGAGSSSTASQRSRTRVLLERNYLLYLASQPDAGFASPWRVLATKGLTHGARLMARRQMSARDWGAVLADLPALLPALAAKTRRDRVGAPCPPAGDGVPESPESRYFALCVEKFVGAR